MTTTTSTTTIILFFFVIVKYDLKTLKIEFEAKFKQVEESERIKMRIEYQSVQIGGDSNILNNVDFTSDNFDNIENDLLDSWKQFFDDENRDNLNVVYAEISRISSSIHDEFSRNDFETAMLDRKIKLAANRISELEREKVQMSLALARTTSLVNSLGTVSDGAKNTFLKNYQKMISHYQSYHVDKVIRKLENYVIKSDDFIMETCPPTLGSAPKKIIGTCISCTDNFGRNDPDIKKLNDLKKVKKCNQKKLKKNKLKKYCPGVFKEKGYCQVTCFLNGFGYENCCSNVTRNVGEEDCANEVIDNDNVDMYNKDEGWLKTAKLDKTQMEEVFFMLSGADLIVYQTSRENTLVDGPVAWGMPVGVPNDIFFYYNDFSEPLIEGNIKNNMWVFKVLGNQWHPLQRRIVENGVPIFNSNFQKYDEIDFEKLPNWLSQVKYVLTKRATFESFPIEYDGFWKNGNFHDTGKLINTGRTSDSSTSSFAVCEIEWNQLSDIHDAKKLLFDFMQIEVYFTGDVHYDTQTMRIMMHGKGELTFGSNTTKGEWKSGQLIINTQEEFLQLNPFLMQEHRYQTSEQFEYSIRDERVDKYMGEVKVNHNGETVQFLRNGEGVLKYTNGEENRGTWKKNKILIRSQDEYNALHIYLKDNNLYEIVGDEDIITDNEYTKCELDLKIMKDRYNICNNDLRTCKSDLDGCIFCWG